MSTGLFEQQKKGWGIYSDSPGDTDVNALFTHIHTPSLLSVAQTACVCCQKTD